MSIATRSTPSMRPAVVEALEGRQLLSTVVGLTLGNQLVQFDTSKPSSVYNQRTITGLNSGDKVVGIDYRPANGQLYGLVNGTTRDRVIRIDAKTGGSQNVFNLTTQLNGSEFGVDFNPVVDALRITSDLDQNLRVPFSTGATIIDGTLKYGANDTNAGRNPNVVASAYTNSFPGTTSTVLYDIDSATDSLAIQNPPNDGTLVTRGPLGVDTTALVGFDVQAATSSSKYGGQAYVSLTRGADYSSRLYTINLGTGGVRDVGAISGGKLRDITVMPAGSDGYGGGYGGGSWGGGGYSSGSTYESTYQRDSSTYDTRYY